MAPTLVLHLLQNKSYHLQGITFNHPTPLWKRLKIREVQHNLNSAGPTTLTLPCSNSFGDSAYSFHAPRLWSALPVSILSAWVLFSGKPSKPTTLSTPKPKVCFFVFFVFFYLVLLKHWFVYSHFWQCQSLMKVFYGFVNALIIY